MEILNLLLDNKLLTLLIALFSTFYWLINRMRTELNEKKKEFMKEVLVSKKSVDSFINEIQEKINHSPNLYKELLSSVLKTLERHLGSLKFFSLKAFDKHLSFSLVYSFLFFYLVWLFGGTGTVGEHQLMPNENRFFITIVLLFEVLAIYFLLTREKEIITFLENKIPLFSRLSNTWKELLLWLVVVGVGVGGVVLNGINSTTILYLLFFIILPIINAMFDYISMIVSRYYAQKILYKHTKKLNIFLDILKDLSIAAILFVTLAFTLYYVVDFTNAYLIKNEAAFIPIEHYKALILSGNLLHPDVLWITLMFVSTLIPTLIHLFLFVYSLMAFILVKPHLHQVVEELKNLDLENHHKKELVAYDLADYRLTGWLRWHNFMASALVITFFVLLGVLISQNLLYLKGLFSLMS